ncbi:MAG: chemotaxis protein CheC [Candidatus Krumholzibacteriota bacterium]|nr:chemotaxis protein CheC [Candidatus Krumholzibacteriota bacterium]
MNLIERQSYLKLDALKELGNISSAHAITGLSELMKKRIDVSITNVDIIPLKIINTLFDGPESMVSVVYLEGYNENFKGKMFLILSYSEADKMVNMVSNSRPEDVDPDEYNLSVLKEVGNIMCGCYLNTMSVFLGSKIMYSVPYVSKDMLGAVMDSILADLSIESDYAIVVETAFNFREDQVNGFLFFIPDTDSLEKLFEVIGV